MNVRNKRWKYTGERLVECCIKLETISGESQPYVPCLGLIQTYLLAACVCLDRSFHIHSNINPDQLRSTQIHLNQPRSTQNNQEQPRSIQINPDQHISTQISPDQPRLSNINPYHPDTTDQLRSTQITQTTPLVLTTSPQASQTSPQASP